MTSVLCGKKYWVILRKKTEGGSPFGDMTSIDAFGGDWYADDPPSGDVYEAEGLLLTKGSVL
jgi:hypothetical protein